MEVKFYRQKTTIKKFTFNKSQRHVVTIDMASNGLTIPSFLFTFTPSTWQPVGRSLTSNLGDRVWDPGYQATYGRDSGKLSNSHAVYGDFLKCWVSPTGPWLFLLKMISTWGVFNGGNPPFKETPIYTSKLPRWVWKFRMFIFTFEGPVIYMANVMVNLWRIIIIFC